jgi:hypothetical protein
MARKTILEVPSESMIPSSRPAALALLAALWGLSRELRQIAVELVNEAGPFLRSALDHERIAKHAHQRAAELVKDVDRWLADSKEQGPVVRFLSLAKYTTQRVNSEIIEPLAKLGQLDEGTPEARIGDEIHEIGRKASEISWDASIAVGDLARLLPIGLKQISTERLHAVRASATTLSRLLVAEGGVNVVLPATAHEIIPSAALDDVSPVIDESRRMFLDSLNGWSQQFPELWVAIAGREYVFIGNTEDEVFERCVQDGHQPGNFIVRKIVPLREEDKYPHIPYV